MLRTAAESRAQQARLTATVLAHSRTEWRRLDFTDLDRSWPRVASRVLPVLVAGQRASAAAADVGVSRMLAEQNTRDDPAGQLNPEALSGTASDGRALDTLLYQPVIATKIAVKSGADQAAATASGLATLDRIIVTQMMDAYRVAAGVGITVRRNVGYVRVLTPPSCSRCAILAGKWYRWQADFERHVSCDCTQIPAAEDAAGDLRTDPAEAFRSGQIKGLSQAEQQAVRDGAELNRVVNAHRGMSTTTIAGRRVSVTSELRSARQAGIRITPGQIYRDATSREDAIRLLRRFGYLT